MNICGSGQNWSRGSVGVGGTCKMSAGVNGIGKGCLQE